MRRVLANENVAADLQKIALERGPVVYCIEGMDNRDNVLDMRLADDTRLQTRFRGDKLGGIVELTGAASTIRGKSKKLTAIPYYAWNHRGANEMTVWIHRK